MLPTSFPFAQQANICSFSFCLKQMPTTELLLISKLGKLIMLREIINTESVCINILAVYHSRHSHQAACEAARFMKSRDFTFEKNEWVHLCCSTCMPSALDFEELGRGRKCKEYNQSICLLK